MKSIRKHEEIYCISEQEKATPRYLTCLVYQIQTCRPKWIEDMLKKKHYIQPESSPKLYVLREKKKYKDKLFKNTTFHLGKSIFLQSKTSTYYKHIFIKILTVYL